MLWQIFISAIISVLFLLSYASSKKSKFPPGPSGLFLNFIKFRSNPLGTLMTWKQQYGPIVGCRIGEFRVVVLNDPATIAKAFASKALNSRPPFLPIPLFVGGKNHGTLTSSHDVWKGVRSIMVKNLARFNILDSPIAGEDISPTLFKDMKPLMRRLNNLAESEENLSLLELRRMLYFPIANLVWYNLTGGRKIPDNLKDQLESQLFSLQKAFWQPIGSCVWFLPTLANIFQSSRSILKEMKDALSPLHEMVEKMVETIKLQEKNEKNNFSKAFLQDCSSLPCLNGAEKEHLKGTFFTLWNTATETVGNLLAWTLLWLALYPEKQEQLAEEFEDNPDMYRLIYANAVIMEVLRLSSTAPFSNFHWSTEDYALDNGMIIPKDTVVIGNLYRVHHDPIVWGEEVESFIPERFLDEENKKRLKSNMIPFSSGLRLCHGQKFAKHFIIFALSKLLKEFRFHWDTKMDKPTPKEILEKSNVSFFRFVPDFKIRVERYVE